MIKLIERGPFLDGSKKLVGVSIYHRDEDYPRWAYAGTLALPDAEWERFKAVIEVGSEENPVGFQYQLEKVS